MLATRVREPVRRIVERTHGHTRGPITRLVSPSDLGGLIKPFVFLDHGVFEPGRERFRMEDFWHPHSGIATVTDVLEGSIRYAETTGKSGEIATGGIEWMRAGNGVWHTGEAAEGTVRIFQLWVALPPELENGPNASHYAKPDEIPVVGPARVILGEYRGARSPIASPPLTYLEVSLKDGEHFRYEPPKGHDVAWVAADHGELATESSLAPIEGGEIAVFEPSEEPIDFVARESTRFVLGSAAHHPHDLVLGNYSVHTNADALRRGEREIRRIARELKAKGLT